MGEKYCLVAKPGTDGWQPEESEKTRRQEHFIARQTIASGTHQSSSHQGWLKAVTVRLQTRDPVNQTSAAYRTQGALWRGVKVRVSGDMSCYILIYWVAL